MSKALVWIGLIVSSWGIGIGLGILAHWLVS